MSQRLVLASGNAGKLKEFGEILAPLKFELLSQKQLGVSDTDGPFDTFVENALRKARHAAACTGYLRLQMTPVFASTRCGAPGVLSARFAGEPSDVRNNTKLIADLQPHDDWSAYYYCVLVLSDMQMTRSLLLLTVFCRDRLLLIRVVKTDSDMTRIFGCLNSGCTVRNWIRHRKTIYPIAVRHCKFCLKN
jgi:hypothetical protein